MTFALALDGRFESFGDYRQPTAATAESTPVQQSATGQVPAVQQQAMPVNTWDAAFGENSYLHHTWDGNSPFIIQTQGRVERKEIVDSEGGKSWQDRSVEGAGQWRYNGKTTNFDFYPAKGEIGVSSFDPTDYSTKPTKSVSASELGLSYDPAFMVSALATKSGKNRDAWSNYALTNNNYGGYGTDAFNRSVSDGFRGEWQKINSYEAKVSSTDKFLESVVIGGIVTIATMGFGAPLAASMQAAGYSAGTAALASNAVVGAVAGSTTAAVTGGDPVKGAWLGAAGGALNGYTSTLSASNVVNTAVNTAGKTALAAVSGGDPKATLASSVAGSAAGAATDSPFVGQLASQAARQLVTKQPTQSISQGSPSTSTKAAQSTQSTQNTPGASFSYSLPSFNYVDLMGKRG